MKKALFTLSLALLPFAVSAQQQKTADELFTEARSVAFEHKDYPSAILLARQALSESPDYTDVAIFLGRVYTWNGNIEEARLVFRNLAENNVDDEDFFIAYTSLEFWNSEPSRALEIAEKGLTKYPNSESLLLLKARIQHSAGDPGAAEQVVKELLSINPGHTEARALLVQVSDLTFRNAVNITYGYSHFDRQFPDDWHLAAISYRRQTPIGPVAVRGTLASKFAATGTQVDVEAYPRLSKMIYLYIGAAYSGDTDVFPKYRTGVSVNANLPKSFEAEIGYRQLYFTDNVWLYTASVGKYYKNLWFNFRTYLTPQSSSIAQSYTGTVRYYTGGAHDYISLQAGSGITPDENRSNLLQDESYRLKTFKIGADYNFTINRRNLVSIGAMYYNQEFRPATSGNQFDVNLGYTVRF